MICWIGYEFSLVKSKTNKGIPNLSGRRSSYSFVVCISPLIILIRQRAKSLEDGFIAPDKIEKDPHGEREAWSESEEEDISPSLFVFSPLLKHLNVLVSKCDFKMKRKEGWLWIKTIKLGDVWSSFYCIGDPCHFEWFKRGDKVRVTH